MDLLHLIQQELGTDSVYDDVTTALLLTKGNQPVTAIVLAREKGVFSGERLVFLFAEATGLGDRLKTLVEEGTAVESGTPVVEMKTTLDQALRLERTLLNYLTHLCGVATLTRKFVDAVMPHPVKILATRKTLPGMREIELAAVRAGGGYVHRRSLSDGILIKENHQTLVSGAELIRRAKRSRSPLHRIEIEVQSPESLDEILAESPDVIMLDNFSLKQIAEAIPRIRERNIQIEISGGVDLDSVSSLANLKPDFISVGKLTHSAPALNLSLDIRDAIQ